jgi:hypothetical protein
MGMKDSERRPRRRRGRRAGPHRVDLVLDLLEGLDGLGGDGAGLGVGHLLLEALDLREELGEEGLGLARVVDELRHVVDNHRHLALDLRLLLLAAAEEDGDGDGERGRVDRLDEDGGRELVDRLRHLVGVLRRADEGRDEGLDVAVVDRVAGLLHRLDGRLLHVGLGVPHARGEDGHRLVEGAAEGARVLLGELAQEVEGENLGLPRARAMSCDGTIAEYLDIGMST